MNQFFQTKTEIIEEDRYETEGVTYFQDFQNEVQKHECTKRALNKAIQLANLLIDELSADSKAAKFKRERDNSEHSSASLKNRFRSPDILSNQRKMEQNGEMSVIFES